MGICQASEETPAEAEQDQAEGARLAAEHDAATKIQAAQRGKQVRQGLDDRRAVSPVHTRGSEWRSRLTGRQEAKAATGEPFWDPNVSPSRGRPLPGKVADNGSEWRERLESCLLYTSDAADEEDSVDLGGRRIIKKKKNRIYYRGWIGEYINKLEMKVQAGDEGEQQAAYYRM
eukprot:TRINITY_DN3202_c0_g1_i3.p2 TRINITY_DN3202_c0_g1~~TRINITY_DN3202_c0_g1_i3.p2  ORF type:complete len:174 (-),score=30.76 TRINITY_DN3202_c0_g1_i3:15-536(-)